MKPIATSNAHAALAAGRLSPVEAAIVQRANGSADLDALGSAAGLSRSALLDRLDALADAGMLAARVSPPTGVSRRGLLGSLLGATAAAAAAGLPRSAQAAPGGSDGTPPMCNESQDIELPIADTAADLQGQDPADLLRWAAAIQVSAVDTSIDADDAAALLAENAAKQLEDLSNAHDSLVLELAADAYLEHSEAAALGDVGAEGRQGDQASAFAAATLRHREMRAKQRGQREHRAKQRLGDHDQELVQIYDTRAATREDAAKKMQVDVTGGEKADKGGAIQAAYKVRAGLEEKMKQDRGMQEEHRKKEAQSLYLDGADKALTQQRIKRLEEASFKHKQSADKLDARLLEGAFAWATADVAARKKSEVQCKQIQREHLQSRVDQGESAQLRKRAEERHMKQMSQPALQMKLQANEKAHKAKKAAQENQSKA